MKKSSIAVAMIILVVAISGLIYIGGVMNKKSGTGDGQKSKLQELNGENDQNRQASNDITFGEYKCVISEDDSVVVKYIKSGQTIKIFSINPVSDISSYDISSNGSSALYLGKDGHIWVIYNDGTLKKITPDRYGNLLKSEVQKRNSSYIWASNPSFMPDGNVEFISNLPDTGRSPGKAIWKINIEDGSMSQVYKPMSENFKALGYRSDDGKYIILDGDKIAAVDGGAGTSGSIETTDVSGKHIINLSPDGKKILFVNSDAQKRQDSSYLYMMDSYGKNIVKLPGVEGYKVTDMGAWNDDGTEYAYIIKPQSGSYGKIAVIYFYESGISIKSYNPSTIIEFPDNCKLRWANGDTISVDTGNDVVNISLNEG